MKTADSKIAIWLLSAAAALLGVFPGSDLCAQQTNERSNMLEKVYELIEAGDSFQAFDHIENEGDPIEVAERYSDLLRDIFGTKRDLPRMIFLRM